MSSINVGSISKVLPVPSDNHTSNAEFEMGRMNRGFEKYAAYCNQSCAAKPVIMQIMVRDKKGVAHSLSLPNGKSGAESALKVTEWLSGLIAPALHGDALKVVNDTLKAMQAAYYNQVGQTEFPRIVLNPKETFIESSIQVIEGQPAVVPLVHEVPAASAYLKATPPVTMQTAAVTPRSHTQLNALSSAHFVSSVRLLEIEQDREISEVAALWVRKSQSKSIFASIGSDRLLERGMKIMKSGPEQKLAFANALRAQGADLSQLIEYFDNDDDDDRTKILIELLTQY